VVYQGLKSYNYVHIVQCTCIIGEYI
jgi:hypothetical protein